jgi:pimeloyl-ACP methyl ester carboxylesterase
VEPAVQLHSGPAEIKPVATHEVRGGDGVRLHVREWGDSGGSALLFIHGWSQSDLCWTRQFNSGLAARHRIVTFDLRGHGLSEKPVGAEHYTDGQLWAEDIAAVIEQTGLVRPVLVAWSYGGYVVIDYLGVFGDSSIGGINLVGAAVLLKPPGFDHLGPGLLDNAQGLCASDLATNIAALQRFVRACTEKPLDDESWNAALCWNMMVPPAVRAALISREISGDVLTSTSVPVLASHGREDAIVSPSMVECTLELCPSAVPSWYEHVGHMPFWEAAERFNRELAEFVGHADSGRSAT